MKRAVPRFMVVLNQATAKHPLPDVARAAIAGGADLVQIREKELDQSALRVLAVSVIEAVGDHGLVSINGDIDLSIELGTSLHLPERVGGDRKIRLQPAALLGRSIHSADRRWTTAEVDYVLLGNLLETASKPGKAGLGPDRFSEITRLMLTPVLAIGGMQPDTLAVAREAGAYGIAVLSFVNNADDPERAAREVKDELERWTN